MKKEYNQDIFQCVKNFLDSEQMRYMMDERRGTFFYRHPLDCSLRLADVMIGVNADNYVVEAWCPVVVNPKDKTRMKRTVDYCQLVTMKAMSLWDAPRDLLVGMIPLVDSGVVKICDGFKSTPEKPLPDGETVKRHMTTALALMEACGDGILEIAHGDGQKSPKEILDLCEKVCARRVAQKMQEALEEMRRKLYQQIGVDDEDDEDGEETEEIDEIELFDDEEDEASDEADSDEPEEPEESNNAESNRWMPWMPRPEDGQDTPAPGCG